MCEVREVGVARARAGGWGGGGLVNKGQGHRMLERRPERCAGSTS